MGFGCKTCDVSRATLQCKMQGTYPDKTYDLESCLKLEVRRAVLVNWIKAIGKAAFTLTLNELLDSVKRLVFT